MRNTVRELIERACQRILPERRLYVVFGSDAPRDLCPGDAFGFTGRRADLAYRDYLKSRNRWHGRGGLIFVDDRLLYRFTKHRAGRRFIHWRREVTACALHELCHIGERPILASDLDEAEDAALPTLIVKSWCATMAAIPRPEAAPIPFAGHDAGFVRQVLHVAHRMKELLPLQVFASDVFDGPQYALSPMWSYSRALADEPERLAGTPLPEIGAIQPPREFADLWKSDVRRWFLANPAPTDSQVNAFATGMRLFTN